MTKQEAICELKYIKDNGFINNDSIIGTDRVKQAINIAIGCLNDNVSPSLKEGYKLGCEDGIRQFALKMIDAYYKDNIDECEINRIERSLLNIIDWSDKCW